MSTFKVLLNRVQDATLRGGGLVGGNREQVGEDINEAIKWVDALLRPKVSTSIEVLTAGQQDYSIATDFGIAGLTSVRGVTYTSIQGPQIYSVEQVSPEYLRELRENVNVTASYWVAAYAIDGLDLFMIYPQTQSVGDTITITYVPRSTTLVLETDIPSGLPEEFHEIYEIAAIQRSMRQSSPEYAASYTQMFEHKCDEYRKWRNRRTGAQLPRAVVGRSRRHLLPHNNSADWR